jgi:hypothetical protein
MALFHVLVLTILFDASVDPTTYNRFGMNCAVKQCPKGNAWFDEAISEVEAHQPAECSNMGICDRSTGVSNHPARPVSARCLLNLSSFFPFPTHRLVSVARDSEAGRVNTSTVLESGTVSQPFWNTCTIAHALVLSAIFMR